MANFDEAMKVILRHEGKYSNDSNDPGGETNYGISKRSYPNLDIKNLTVEQAEEIYKRDFWDANNLERIQSDAVATKIFDMCVNMGSKRGIELAQRAVSEVGQSINEDGRMGPVTYNNINSLPEEVILRAIKNQAISYYRAIVARKPSMSKYINSWLKRAEE